VHLVPTPTAGEWRDNGTGTWTINGNSTGMVMGACPPDTTSTSGSGTFLTDAGTGAGDKAALLLSGFDPAGATGSPSLTWDGEATTNTTTSFYMAPMPPAIPGGCFSSSSSGTQPFTMAAPGATGTYTGTTGAARGLTFSYSGSAGLEMVTVSGSLTPVA